ncbi:rod shape-determining protein MreD [Paenibacillus protaetiae]|uniref:Rod shape-determining protein MreD n=1 Tax=Paenibacillus protaetiae TaxID=2509456 RepID=A0A4P6EQP6_9BACL|nr:rod shape-determining protein MreD [Paenibacillus protaetiae]QAY65162.1 rod shape-determining protein MreD [Paenibacillus protaetiae]
MSINRLIGFMLLLFIVEGTIMPWVIPAGYTTRIVPHFVFVVVIFSALYSNRHRALFLGAGFGLLQDVAYYGHMIGPNLFFMGILGYYTGVLFENKRVTLLAALSVIGINYILYDSMMYGIYFAFRITNESFAWALMDHILPSLFLQLAFALLVYVPLRKHLESAVKKKLDKDEQ